MKKLFSFSVFVCLLLSLSSCEELFDRVVNATIWGNGDGPKGNYTSPYMGKWTGIYSGDENGDLVLNVAKSGGISGTITKKTYLDGNLSQEAEDILGAVLEGGSLMQVNSINHNYSILGNLETKSGTWKKGNLTGTWKLTKQ
jgi:hypothetical protein